MGTAKNSYLRSPGRDLHSSPAQEEKCRSLTAWRFQGVPHPRSAAAHSGPRQSGCLQQHFPHSRQRKGGKVSPSSRGSATVRFYHNNRSVGAPVTTARILFTPACHGKWHCYTRYFRAPDIKGGVLSAQWLCGVDSQGDDTPIYFDDLELYRLSK